MTDLYKVVLHTKDGRKVGNAICLSLNTEAFLEIVTDYGNLMKLTHSEVNELFYIGEKARKDHKHYFGIQ